MAKPVASANHQQPVLLTLKSELWQSRRRDRRVRRAVLLTLKSELWQSYLCSFHYWHFVLLTLKSELWQSTEQA